MSMELQRALAESQDKLFTIRKEANMFALMEHSKKTEAKQAQDGLETLSKLQDGAEVFKPVGKMFSLMSTAEMKADLEASNAKLQEAATGLKRHKIKADLQYKEEEDHFKELMRSANVQH